MYLEFSRWNFAKSLGNKFSSKSVQREPCGRTDGRKDIMTKLIVAFRNLANASKMFLTAFHRLLF
jgi:hypothetical protein